MIYNQTMSAAAKESVPESTLSVGDECSTLIEEFLGTIAKMTGAIAGAVRVHSPDGKELRLVGSFGLPPDVVECEDAVNRNCGACGIAAGGSGNCSSGVEACMLRNGRGFFGKTCKCMIAVPLEVRGKTTGIFNLFFASAQAVPEETEKNLRSFGELLGTALENSIRSREIRRMGLMTERRLMANEIHDSLAQTLVYARMRMSLLCEAIKSGDERLTGKYVSDVNEALASGQGAVRELITHFRSPMDPLGLPHALRELVDEFRERSGIALDYTSRIADFMLPIEYELQAFHIVREVLANVAMHSRASRASLAVGCHDGCYLFTIEDNGSGIPDIVPSEGHYGLTIMRERAMRLGGKIEVESAKGLGTKVMLSFPITQEVMQ